LRQREAQVRGAKKKGNAMIGYITVGTNNLEKAVAFYSELLGLFGAKEGYRSERGVGWSVSPDAPMFCVTRPFDQKGATVGNGSMVALEAANPEQVRAVHAKALALGGKDEGAPGPRGDNFYGAYFRDLDGNKISAYCTP
jgi:catechol 2,3-dioxygenase-like lactoylglutathione lyase family enzyme